MNHTDMTTVFAEQKSEQNKKLLLLHSFLYTIFYAFGVFVH